MSGVFKAGEIYSFKTSPFNKFSESNTQRYACLKILGPGNDSNESKETIVTYVVLDGVYDAVPSIDEISRAKPLIRKRFMYGQLTPFQRMSKNPPKNVATNSARSDWVPDLLEFSLVGSLPLSAQEKILAEENASFSAWRFASLDAEGEWRWEHDKDKLLAERDLQDQEKERIKQAKKERFEKRLSNLTWEKLSKENLFERWAESPPIPPQPFTDLLVNLIRATIFDLKALGPKYPRAKVRKMMKALVKDISNLDYEFDFVIETEEREDIYNVFDDLTFLAKQRVLMEEIPDWHHLKW